MSDSYYDRTLLYFCSFLFFMLCLYTWAIPFREIFGLEVRNALITREMLDGGLTIIPHAIGRHYPDYPSLFFWTATLFSMPFGQVTPLSVTLPSTLSAIGLVALSFRMGREINPRVGWLAALILATFPEFWMKACEGTIDMVMVFHVASAVTCLYFRDKTDRAKVQSIYALGAGIFLILGFLTKGPIGPVLTGTVWGSYLFVERRIKDILIFFLFMAGIFAVCVLGEIIAVWLHGGGAELIRKVIHAQVTGRVGERPNSPYHYYLIVLLGVGSLWWLWCIPGLKRFLSGLREAKLTAFRQILPKHPVNRLALVWLLGGLTIFTLATTKHSRYLLPLFSPLAILLATNVDRMLERSDLPCPQIWTGILNIFIALLLLAGTGFPLFFPEYRFVPVIWIIIWLFSVSGGWLMVGIKTRNGLRVAGLLLLFLAAGLSGANLMVTPWLSRNASGKSFVLTAESLVADYIPVALYGIAPDGDGAKYALHTTRKPETLQFISEQEELRHLSRPCLLITLEEKSNLLRKIFSAEMPEIIARGAIRSCRLVAYLLR